jgi:superfamily II DNA/RNA helicase
MVDEVVDGLQARGYLADGLHGDHTQATREKVLRSFRSGRIEVLVATDVAARGLDIPEVSHVVNFDIPPDPEYYVHRIGRTGRLGRSGEAITFVNPRQMRELKVIERVTGAHIRREEVPTVAEVEEREFQALEERLQASLASGTWGRYRSMIEELADEHDPVDLAAAALAMAVDRGSADRRTTAAPEAPERIQAPRGVDGRRPSIPQDEPIERPAWRRDRPAEPAQNERPKRAWGRGEEGLDRRTGERPDRRTEESGPPVRTERRPRRSEADAPADGAPKRARVDRPKFSGKPTGKGRPPTGGGAHKPHRKGPPSSGRRDKKR